MDASTASELIELAIALRARLQIDAAKLLFDAALSCCVLEEKKKKLRWRKAATVSLLRLASRSAMSKLLGAVSAAAAAAAEPADAVEEPKAGATEMAMLMRRRAELDAVWEQHAQVPLAADTVAVAAAELRAAHDAAVAAGTRELIAPVNAENQAAATLGASHCARLLGNVEEARRLLATLKPEYKPEPPAEPPATDTFPDPVELTSAASAPEVEAEAASAESPAPAAAGAEASTEVDAAADAETGAEASTKVGAASTAGAAKRGDSGSESEGEEEEEYWEIQGKARNAQLVKASELAVALQEFLLELCGGCGGLENGQARSKILVALNQRIIDAPAPPILVWRVLGEAWSVGHEESLVRPPTPEPVAEPAPTPAPDGGSDPTSEEVAAATKVQAIQRGRMARKAQMRRARSVPAQMKDGVALGGTQEENLAAARLQARQRGRVTRRQLARAQSTGANYQRVPAANASGQAEPQLIGGGNDSGETPAHAPASSAAHAVAAEGAPAAEEEAEGEEEEPEPTDELLSSKNLRKTKEPDVLLDLALMCLRRRRPKDALRCLKLLLKVNKLWQPPYALALVQEASKRRLKAAAAVFDRARWLHSGGLEEESYGAYAQAAELLETEWHGDCLNAEPLLLWLQCGWALADFSENKGDADSAIVHLGGPGSAASAQVRLLRPSFALLVAWIRWSLRERLIQQTKVPASMLQPRSCFRSLSLPLLADGRPALRPLCFR